MAASTKQLGTLHEVLTQVLIDRLGDSEMCSAADLSVARAFLSDNKITAVVEESAALQELDRKLEARRGRRRTVTAPVEVPDGAEPTVAGLTPDDIDAAANSVLAQAGAFVEGLHGRA